MIGKLILWSIIAYGMTSIIVWGTIIETPREWIKNHIKFLGKLISCVLCTATWIGFILSISLGGLTNQFFDIHWIPTIFFDGMFTAGIVWAINSFVEFFEESRINSNINDTKDDTEL